MSTLELKQELYTLINEADDNFVKKIYKIAQAHAIQLKHDEMIAEAEEDIRNGRLYSKNEVKKMIASWKE